MTQEIRKQIAVINDSLAWIRKNKADHYEQRFMQLVEERRKLRRLLIAECENPAIAAFGESQKGKSYLMGNLLQNNGAPFMVKINGGKDEVNFVQSVNPIGDKKEATGVVTRFTTFSRQEQQSRYNAELPVIVKLLSPASIATILCDSYHKDIQDYQSYSDQEIALFTQEIVEKYRNLPDSGLTAFVEDDVLDIKHYLTKFLPETQGLRRSNYFENLALVIRKIPATEWGDVLGFLWHQNPIVSALFRRMTAVLQKLNFATELYTDIETVRHYGDNTNTIMSVDCLNGLDDRQWDKTAVVYTRDANGQFNRISDIAKCELAAVCAETVYKVEKEYVDDEMQYHFYPGGAIGDMPQDTLTRLPKRSIAKADLLMGSDLLDLPGARNRLSVKEEFLDNIDPEAGASNSVQMLLRGKVAYLFNSYSESRVINILLFCHDQEAIVVNNMYIMVNDWVEKYVGRTAEERRRTIEQCGGVSPLFNICTKFNIDMIENENDEKNNDAALNQRWSGRLVKVLYTQAFKANDVDWFRNWDGPQRTFKNSYLLRDFKYSGCSGSGNNLFDGYKETDAEPQEESMKLTPQFYRRMRDTFITNQDVQMFFGDPAMAWDLAATRNNDGALFIIDKLTTVSRHLAQTRHTQFRQQVDETRRKVLGILSEYRVSEDADEMLRENMRKANAIIREMDFTCNDDNYFFGHLLQALQVTETQCLQQVHYMIQSGELGERNNNFANYEIILKRCADFADCKSTDDCWQKLIDVYGMMDRDEAEAYLNRRGVVPQTLFSKTFKKKLNSCIIADNVYSLWAEGIKSAEFMNRINANQLFDSVVMSSLLDDILDTSAYLHLTDILAESIAEYVNIINIYTINESLVADILSSTINSFVGDIGYSLLTEDDRKNARQVAKQYRLPAFEYIGREQTSHFDEQQLTALFDELTDNPKAMTASFENNYYTWLEYMYVSFIAHLNVPPYDKDANQKLAEIIRNME